MTLTSHEHQAAYTRGSKRLFNEALNYYLHAMRDRNLLNREDKELILLAVHGLAKLNNYPLARALIHIAFTYLTADEMSDWIEKGRQAQRSLDCVIPF